MIQINRHQQKSTEINRHQHINTSFNGLLWLCFDFGYWKPLKTPNLQDLARSLKYAVLCEEVREKDRALPKMIIDANDLSFFFWKFGFSMTIHQNKKTPETQNKTQNERTERHCDDRSLIFRIWSSSARGTEDFCYRLHQLDPSLPAGHGTNGSFFLSPKALETAPMAGSRSACSDVQCPGVQGLSKHLFQATFSQSWS